MGVATRRYVGFEKIEMIYLKVLRDNSDSDSRVLSFHPAALLRVGPAGSRKDRDSIMKVKLMPLAKKKK